MITQEEIQKAYQRAPEHIQTWIDSDELAKAFDAIRTKYNLHVDHAGNLAIALDAVILELKQFTELPALLKEGLASLDDATRDKVVKDVNDTVFVPLRALVKKHADEVATKAREEAELNHRVDTMIEAEAKLADAEAKLKTTPPPVIAPARTTPQTQAPASILQQKMSTAVAPPPSVQEVPAPNPTPVAPPRYHGTDPYREPPA